MPVKLRITLLFTVLAGLILGIVCVFVYYYFENSRTASIKTRLTNRAITVGRLLSQREIFSNELIRRIDSSTSFVLKNNVILAYNSNNQKIYSYSSLTGDSLDVSQQLIDNARKRGKITFTAGNKEAVAYRYVANGMELVTIAAGEDAEGKEDLHSLFNILMVSFLAGLSLAGLGGYYFSKRLLKPINKIATDVKDISAMSLSRRLVTGTANDEWHHLSTTLNDLLNRLQESFDIQKRFISNASHELSTPLTSISSQIEVSLQRERNAGEYKEVLQSIYQDVMHMSNLTQTLLQFAQASGTPGGLEIALVRIDEVLLRLPSEVVKANKGYSVLLNFDELPDEEEGLLVFGNEHLLFTAIKNIVMNACKYSNNHQAVVWLHSTEAGLKVVVEDKGIGIPEEDLPMIFQPFYRVNDNKQREGFGLGLSLASRIINLHKGRVEVQSELGKGTTFTIHLPGAKQFISEGKS
ncbi:sensor histidine kinase [Aridibaculum aurantiacum]|uniref:sensor histidine kinase n=1 Tax=Aridibaculum aurantiacum TaxID=2810307 RepID=UPI001A97595A|nr:HAMP domain-containing sensor histidine kinase [Aridibaculum aurantiacum]